nr:MAG TPA: carbohydrate esterase [Bacteriophage sp.]
MEKIFDIAKDSEQSWGTLATAIDGNFEEVYRKIGEIGGSQQKLVITADDFVIGRWSDTSAVIDANQKTWKSYKELLVVKEGDEIVFKNWSNSGTEAAVIALPLVMSYGADKGAGTRHSWKSVADKDFVFTIPQGVEFVGIISSNTYYTIGTTEYGEDKSFEFSQQAENAIITIVENEIIGGGSTDGGVDYNLYYHRGAYGKSFDYTKKLCVLTGGQSNSAGRNDFQLFPFELCGQTSVPESPFNLPNVNIIGYPNNDIGGNATSFVQATLRRRGTDPIVDPSEHTGSDDWSFDSIVYALLTNSDYGKQNDIHVVKQSIGSTSIDEQGTGLASHWTADYKNLLPTYSLLKNFEEYIRKALELQAQGYEVRAMCWHQGESDGTSQEVANRYYDNFKKMIAYIRGILGNPYLLFYCGTISKNRPQLNFTSTVNKAILKVASEDQYVRVVDMSGAKLEDAYHFNYKASIYFGKAIYNMMCDDGVISNGTKIDNPLPDDWSE